jgi:hypothetical protein
MAVTEFAMAIAVKSKHFPLMSRFQKEPTGVQLKSLKETMMVEFIMTPTRKM